eukprot:Skav213091  [mRNA]  locus=scaffold512:89742:90458:- [translate_table: standard]
MSLHEAAQEGNTEKIQELLIARADVNAKNEKGWTALMLAAFVGHEASVCLLLEARANVKAANNDGRGLSLFWTGAANAES